MALYEESGFLIGEIGRRHKNQGCKAVAIRADTIDRRGETQLTHGLRLHILCSQRSRLHGHWLPYLLEVSGNFSQAL